MSILKRKKEGKKVRVYSVSERHIEIEKNAKKKSKNWLIGTSIDEVYMFWTALFENAKSEVRIVLNEEIKRTKNNEFYQNYLKSLKSAIENRNVTIKILVLDDVRIADKTHDVLNVLADFKVNKKQLMQVRILKSVEFLPLNYREAIEQGVFEVFDENGVWIENNKGNSSVCCFNERKAAKKLVQLFDKVYNAAEEFNYHLQK